MIHLAFGGYANRQARALVRCRTCKCQPRTRAPLDSALVLALRTTCTLLNSEGDHSASGAFSAVWIRSCLHKAGMALDPLDAQLHAADIVLNDVYGFFEVALTDSKSRDCNRNLV